jgi:drug/metabolite transporter (DMT)-like permease
MRSAQKFIPAILAMAFWATNFVFSLHVLDGIGVMQATGARWLISLVALVPLAIVMEHPDWSIARREWRSHLVQSLLGYSGYTVLLYFALGVTSPVSAAVLVALNPATIAIAARIVLHEHLAPRAIVGIAVSFVGALVVVLGAGTFGEFNFTYGDGLLLIATVLWTVYSIRAPKLETPPITATTVQAGLAGIIMIPFMVVDIALGNSGWATLDPLGWMGIVWIGLFPSAASYFLWNISSEKIGPTRTGAFLNLIPVFTAVIVVVLGGAISVAQLVGGALVLIGVSFANARAKS